LISQADKLVLTLHFWSLGFFKEERTDIQALNKGKQAKTGVSLQDVNKKKKSNSTNFFSGEFGNKKNIKFHKI
jgi:hypothetical protein